MNDADRAVVAHARHQYQSRSNHLNQLAIAGAHNPDELMARLCRDYGLPPETINSLARLSGRMMNAELTS